jgi:hypothetical protein
MAGVPGFEPGLSVLETDVLTVDTIPLRCDAGMGRRGEAENLPVSASPLSPCQFSLRLFVTSVLAATATELAEFQAIGRGLLVLGRHVVPTLALVTLKHNVVSRHN